MLLVLTGSSGSGKTTLVRRLPPEPDLVVHDFDEHGVPESADTAWRQRTLDTWITRAAEFQRDGRDMVLAGQSPLGEVLAAPSASRLDGVAVVLIDLDDDERLARLRTRGSGEWPAPSLDACLGWARWHRGHAADPHHAPEVIVGPGDPRMEWDRWRSAERWNPRLRPEIIDTTARSIDESVSDVSDWIDRHRAPRGRTGG